MTISILVPELLKLIDNGDSAGLMKVVEAVHPAMAADFVVSLDDVDVWRFLSLLPQQQSAGIFSHFDLEKQVRLATGANQQAMARMLEELPHDDRVDLVQRLDSGVSEQIFPLVALPSAKTSVNSPATLREQLAP